jgi:hypothetical protein
MNRRNWVRTIGGIQLTNALLLFTFSIYLAVAAYPVVAFFRERDVTITFVAYVAVFVVLGVLTGVGWWGLRKDELWAWWLALCADALVCVLLTLDSLSMGLRETHFLTATIALLSAADVVLLLMPAARKHYSRRSSMQAVNL